MADVVGLTLVKRMPYRGDTLEEWSNTYWMSGTVPSTSAAWKTLADAVGAQEAIVYPADVWIVRAYGYGSDADDAVAIWSYDYWAHSAYIPGSLGTAGDVMQGGDSAVWIRWKTNRLNSKGRPIYLRKYFHPAVAESSTATDRDLVSATQRSNLMAFATHWADGTAGDGRWLRARKWAEGAAEPTASTYVTTRTLKRRGKRP